jgi:hypothetical protein
MNPPRREVLAGAAAVAATVATPGSAVATALGEQAEFAAIQFPLWDIRYMMSALSLLKHQAGQAGLSPATYGEEIGYALRYAVFAGWAVRTETGHLRITETGRREHELERRENR